MTFKFKPMSKYQATEYFESKSKFKEKMDELKHREIQKIYTGRQFVLFNQDLGNKARPFRILANFVVTAFYLDDNGVTIEMEDDSGYEFSFSHIPTALPHSDLNVFVSTPSCVWINREVLVDPDTSETEEITSVAMMIKQAHKPDRFVNGIPKFTSWDDFKQIKGGNYA